MNVYDIKKSQVIINTEVENIVEMIFDNRNNDNFYHKSAFNTKDLPSHNEYSYFPNIDPYFRTKIFQKLDDIKENHCLYWFELETTDIAENLNFLIDDYRMKYGQVGYKKVPAKNSNKNSNVLYLGVRQGGCRKRDN